MLGHVQPHHRMASLVIGRQRLFLFGHDHRATLSAHHHLVLGGFEILHGDEATANARSHKSRFVDQVGQIRARETGGAAGDNPQIHIRAQRHFGGVHAEDFFAALHIGIGHLHLTVKAARTQQGRVQHVGAVGCRNDDDALIGLKAVHFNQQLVERLLALIMTAA